MSHSLARGARCLIAGVALLVHSSPAQAAPARGLPTSGDEEAGADAPRVAPTRLPEGTVVRVDGHLDEEHWAEVARLPALSQVDPRPLEPPTYPTDVRLAYDRDFFYVGVTCHDDPREVRARQMERDERVRYDDVVDLWFDTFDDGRSAFWFQISAGGSRGDGLIADSGQSFNKNWDGIWYGVSRRTEHGWEAELAFPFQTLAFREASGTWGFNLRRQRVANGEELRWSALDSGYRFFTLAEGGKLVGLQGMQQGLGLDVKPYAKLSAGRMRLADDDDLHTLSDIGLDAVFRPTPGTALSFTLNTDFAETEVDTRQVNLTRFPLFFPEKRDFFLEDAGAFEFGRPERRTSLTPFFSRTIGRDSDGDAIPILAGAKFTGRVGDWSIGALTTHLDQTSLVPESDLAVLRLSRRLGEETAVGGILTLGDPLEDRRAGTIGLDYRTGSTRLFGPGHSANLWAWWIRTAAEGVDADGDSGEGDAWGLEMRSNSRTWENEVSWRVIGDEFDPVLGFVRQRGIRRYRWETRYTWRDDEDVVGLRSAFWRIAPTYTRKLDGEVDSWALPVRWLGVELDSEDKIELETHRIFERIDEEFDVSDVDVSTGDYTMTRHFLTYESSRKRLINGEVELEFGDFYSGDIERARVEPVIFFGPHLTVRGGIEHVTAELDEGDIDTWLVGTNVDVSFTPDLSWKNLLQYDTESEALGVQSRLRWIVEPGRDLFVVGLFGWEREEEGEPLVPSGQELVLKLGYTLRF